MKRMQLIVPALCLLALGGLPSIAQKKPARPAARKPAASTTPLVPPLEVRAAREKTDIQLQNVEFWIQKLGPVASALETLDKAYARIKADARTLATHEERKQSFAATLRNLRGDLRLLESEFRTKPSLQDYLPKIQGVTDLAGQAEDLAVSGKLVDSLRPLRDISMRLTETLAVMPR